MVTTNLKHVVDWWVGQLADLAQIDKLSHGQDTVIIDLSTPKLVLKLRVKGKIRALDRVPADLDLPSVVTALSNEPSMPKGLLLLVPQGDLVTKRLVFPYAVHHRLDEVIGAELDRETPFTNDDVYWNYLVRDKGPQTVTVDLVVVPRKRVKATLDRLRAAGLKPDGLYVELEPDLGITVELEPQSHWKKIQADRSKVTLAVAALGLALVAATLPFGLQALELNRTRSTAIALSAQAREAGTLRHSIDSFTTNEEFISRKRAATISALAILANSSDVIPDDSFLTELSLHGTRLSLAGSSPAAAKLVGLLAATPGFKDPAFDGPVIQAEGGTMETFTITVTAQTGGAS